MSKANRDRRRQRRFAGRVGKALWAYMQVKNRLLVELGLRYPRPKGGVIVTEELQYAAPWNGYRDDDL